MSPRTAQGVPLLAPSPGFQLIEASAGTGKTYTITSQYVLLVLETGLRVDQVLVVTYTEAATAELRDRIRTRIREIHDAVAGDTLDSIDDGPLRAALQRLTESDESRTRALRRLDSALVCFDQAAIYTIHGFCNRVLAEEAFAAGTDFQMEVVADEMPMLELVVADFVRTRIGGLSGKEYDAFVAHSPLVDGVGKGDLGSPGRLMLAPALKTLASIISNPFTEVLPADPSVVADEQVRTALNLTRELIDYAREELPRRKREAGVISYGDMLLGVWKALGDGPRLAADLRRTYRAALIDEFQDTNPLQYDIFRKIFSETGTPVVFVGDPKQAIFAFNGGDIFAYFDATHAISPAQRKTLDVNYRSADPLVRGISDLFTGVRKEDTFADGGRCTFPEVRAFTDTGKNPRRIAAPAGRGALHWFLMPGDQLRKKPEAVRMAIAITVAEIRDLLQNASGEEGLRPGDIAVLVRTNAQGKQVQDVLKEAGIPSVINARGDVFESPEAGELLLVLRAVADPRNDSALAAALLSSLLGYTAGEIAQLHEETGRYEPLLEEFVDLQALWTDRQGGFLRMATEILHRHGLASGGGSMIEQIGTCAGNERTLTNLLHLFELLHQESLLHPGPRHLVNWMERRIADSGEREAPLRLESDEARVQIVTIHSSKGLEYPVVFVPFAWEGKGYVNRKRAVVFCHESGTTAEQATRRIADLGSPDRKKHSELAERELVSENIRLLYVAMTRARQRCYVVWGKVNKMHEAALPWLLFGRFDGLSTFVKDMSYDAVTAPVKNLARRSPGVTWTEVSTEPKILPLSLTDAAPPELRARVYSGRPITAGWGTASYTSLAKNWAGPSRDRDSSAEVAPREEAAGIFTFPAGARTGIVWHDLFEHLDFQADDAAIRAIAAEIPRKAGAPDTLAPAVESMIHAALKAPITPDHGRLCDLTDTVRELEFTFSVSRFRTAEIRQILQDPANGLRTDFRDAAGQLTPREVSGFMVGAIDLVFQWNGRFFLADYKSNALGRSAEEYSSGRLAGVMAREHYYLQYLIYTVAAHRYLSHRLPGYSYSMHFGGAAYLFLRGIAAGTGLFFDRPSEQLITALETALTGGIA